MGSGSSRVLNTSFSGCDADLKVSVDPNIEFVPAKLEGSTVLSSIFQKVARFTCLDKFGELSYEEDS